MAISDKVLVAVTFAGIIGLAFCAFVIHGAADIQPFSAYLFLVFMGVGAVRWLIESLIRSIGWHEFLAQSQSSIHWRHTWHLATAISFCADAFGGGSSAPCRQSVLSHYFAKWQLNQPEESPQCARWISSLIVPFLLIISVLVALFSGEGGLYPLGGCLVLVILLAGRIRPRSGEVLGPHSGAGDNRIIFLAVISGFLIEFLALAGWAGREMGSTLFWSAILCHLTAGLLFPWRGVGSREFLFATVSGFSFLGPDQLSGAYSGYLSVLCGLSSGHVAACVLTFSFQKLLQPPTTSVGSPLSDLRLSIIIPARNESAVLARTLESLSQSDHPIHEIILVDGQSSDDTAAIARKYGCRIVSSPPSRGMQMKSGAEISTGEILFFCHADTRVPPHFAGAIQRCLRDPHVVWGGLWKKFDHPSVLMRGSRFRCWTRWMLSGRVFGDQGIFVRRQALEQAGGFPDVPLMEEFELARRMRPLGRMALADATVITSTRKFRKLGVLKTYWRMGLVTTLYYLGVPHHHLNNLYRKN